MSSVLNKIKATIVKAISVVFQRIRAYLPEKLPTGKTAMEAWMNQIILLSGIQADIDSMHFALATMILHAENSAKYLSKNYFIRRLHKGAANQVASQVFQDIKEKQQTAMKAAQSIQPSTPAADTATQAVPDAKPE
jgi:hypothetical protein